MSPSHTQSRVLQWIGIIIALLVVGGAYWYFQVRASTLNQSKNDLVTNGLVGLWSFNGDDMSGNTAYDRSGSGNNGTLSGPTKDIGKVGQALSFDGSNDYVDVTDVAFAGAFTFSTWFYTTNNSQTGIIFGDDGSNGGGGAKLGIVSGNIFVRVMDAGSSDTTVTAPVVSQWHHVVLTRDGSNKVDLYIDGVLVKRLFADAAQAETFTFDIIGSAADLSQNFLGKLDEVRAYNRILTASEIQSLYAQGGGTKVDSAVSQAQGTGRLDSGLAGYWKLDENTGTSATDSSTNTISALTLTNGPTWSTGQIGSSINFDGTDDYATTADNNLLDFVDTENFTLTGWFNRDTFTTDDAILSERLNITAGYAGYILYIDDATDKLTFEASDGTDEYQLESATTFTATGWNHYVIVWDDSGSSQTKLYINGVSEVATATGTFVNVNSLANSNPFSIGGFINHVDAVGYPFDGTLDEVRVYNRALSADEIGQLYRLTSPTSVDTSLKGYWSFNGTDMSGTTAYDRSGAGNTGTLTGGPVKTIGVVGQGVDLDGSNDYVSVADANILDGFSDLTFSGWFNRDTFTTDDTIIAKKNSSAIGDAGYIVYIDATTDQLIFKISNGTNEYSLTSKTTFTSTGWNFFMVSWVNTGPAGSRMYINGLDNSATHNSGTWSISDDPTNALVLALGAESDAGGPFDGKLDEVRFYAGALTAVQAKTQYDASVPDKGNSSASQPQGTGRLDSGLAGYWKLDETTSSSAADASTNGNNGTLVNMENGDWTTGQIGNGLTFDGTDEYVDAGTSSSLRPTGALTLSVWVQSTADVQVVLGSRGSGSTGGFTFNAKGSGNTICRFTYFGIADWDSASGCSSYEGLWHHYVVTTDATTAVKFYRDGVFQSQNNTAVSSGTASDQKMVLGALQNTASVTNFLDGKLDEVRIYNRVLSADEVGQLYRLTTPTGSDTSLKGYWSFNGQDVSGTTAYDRSGVGNTGTLSGPTKTIGKLGQGLNFDGSDDYITSVANSTALASLTQGSFAFWIKPRGVPNQGVIFRSGADGGGNSPTSGFEISGDLWAGNQTIRFMTAGSTGDMMARSTTVLTLNVWTHVVVVWDGTLTAANVKFYQNGVLDTTATQFNGSGSYVASDGSFIFGMPDGSGSRLDGILDEFRIYNRQLSADEVTALYNQSR